MSVQFIVAATPPRPSCKADLRHRSVALFIGLLRPTTKLAHGPSAAPMRDLHSQLGKGYKVVLHVNLFKYMG